MSCSQESKDKMPHLLICYRVIVAFMILNIEKKLVAHSEFFHMVEMVTELVCDDFLKDYDIMCNDFLYY